MSAETGSLLNLISGFVVELRAAGLPVSLTENLDAMEALAHIPIIDRDAFKSALASTLIKNQAHRRAFDTVFDVYFSLRGPEYHIGDDDSGLNELWDELHAQRDDTSGTGGGSMDALSHEELAMMLMNALSKGDQAMMQALARQAVQRYAGMEPGRPVGGTYYLYRTIRNLDLDSMMDALMEQARQARPDMTSLDERLEHDEFEHRIEELTQEIEAEIRRRLVDDRGAEAMAKTLRKLIAEKKQAFLTRLTSQKHLAIIPENRQKGMCQFYVECVSQAPLLPGKIQSVRPVSIKNNRLMVTI